MQHFWHAVVQPALKQLKPKNITEIGADTGINTRLLLEFCSGHDARLTSIDPKPSYDVTGLQAEFGKLLNPIFAMSLEVIPAMGSCDVMLIDGDHNWYTVYHELKAIEERFGDQFPVVLFHDTGWPYGRRDMYYDPGNVPAEFVQPHRLAGIVYGQSELAESGGLNPHFHQAMQEGTPRNGVLTAIEDFQRESSIEFTLISYDGFYGLSLLFPADRKDVAAVFENLDVNRQLTVLLEQHRITKPFETKFLEDKIRTLEKRLEHERIASEVVTQLENQSKATADQHEIAIVSLAKSKKRLRDAVAQQKRSNAQIRELRKELIRTKEIAQSMRLVNRFKRRTGLTKLQQGDIKLLAHSLRHDGVKTTLLRIRQRIQFEGAQVNKVEANQEQPEKAQISALSAAEIETQVASFDVSAPTEAPLVSVIILTHNGLVHLQRLFPALEKNTVYTAVELILVDNASSDGSLDYLDRLQTRFPLKLIRNAKNESYSRGHNQAVEVSSGKYLLFLNNDIVPLKGWLCRMVIAAEATPGLGSVGAQLIYPDSPDEPLSGLVQHSGVCFEYEYSEVLQDDFIRPYNLGVGQLPRVGVSLPMEDRVAMTAACLLLPKANYQDIGGFDETFVYGYEDVDLGLRLYNRGLRNLYCPSAILVHHESSTQKAQSGLEVRNRRTNNMHHFKGKWYDKLFQQYFAAKLSGDKVGFYAKKMHFAFAVTEAGPDVSAGDYFTAMELAGALEARGFIVSYLTRRSGHWYDIEPSTDVIVSMLDAYDTAQLPVTRKKVLTIAWVRNWSERWLQNPSLDLYDVILCSSNKLCEVFKQRTGREVHCFPIACNPNRFNAEQHQDEDFKSDYAFTGSYWASDRAIVDALDPSNLDFEFALYGKNWEKLHKLKAWHKGFLAYEDMPKVYANTRVVIDDAAVSTEGSGSVNSRVFDALASGTLVVTNQDLGARELFGSLLPVWRSGDELTSHLETYLRDEPRRLKLVAKLRDEVLNFHTYDKRALQLFGILKSHLKLKKLIAIKIPCPDWDIADTWGDYHLARGLKKYFERLGYSVLLQLLPEWDNGESDACDVVIVLRGLSIYSPKPHQLNFMWNISHPDKITDEEYNSYDKVFVASDWHAEKLRSRLTTRVEVMHQCTDSEHFCPEAAANSSAPHYELLFVGNSRKMYRKILKDLIPTNHSLAVYGAMWDGIIDREYIKGEHIPNHDLAGYYARADILLNDHWDSMRTAGFISNRIFDGLAAGALIVTDRVRGVEKLFTEEELPTYSSRTELHAIIDRLIADTDAREGIVGRARHKVLEQHTFAHRVRQFEESFELEQIEA